MRVQFRIKCYSRETSTFSVGWSELTEKGVSNTVQRYNNEIRQGRIREGYPFRKIEETSERL